MSEEEKNKGQNAMDESGMKKSKKDMFLENIRAKYPDISDEDDLYGAAMSGYDAEHEWAKKQREENKRMSDALSADPQLASFVTEVFERGKDGHPELALLNFGDLMKSYMMGELSSDEYLSEKQKRDAEKQETEKKIEAQNAVFEKWCSDKGYDPDEWLQKASEMLLTPMSKYEMAEAQFDAIDKLINYDEDVAAAEEAGRVAGRNERIVAQRKKEKNVDGIPRSSSEQQRADASDTGLSGMVRSRKYRNSLN